jgi:hypothetical protein
MNRKVEFRKSHTLIVATLVTAATAALLTAGADNKEPAQVPAQRMADALHAVIEADRTVYARHVVNRLVNQEAAIKASEHWGDDRSLPLPAQMLRMGAELALEKGADVSYALLSTWPINPQNAPRTVLEKSGLHALNEQPGRNHYGEEVLGGKRYFTAVYADVAVAKACVECHNKHPDSPKTDFEVGDVMGGIVVRIPL